MSIGQYLISKFNGKFLTASPSHVHAFAPS